ncbi:hypothetical protein [Sphingobium yanoikuyae]|uniref:Uncharacterized protein n=1 Tax=Sphingobium yanoikuyae TaxID=13690 RepID=A0A430BLF5_SPHYA|nr:hypothetical protein [Sphingobium yanoikuyae]RSU52495.1 hypothetical protein DAH51_21300 [Sphingobium yanoikuyae]
MLHAIEVLLEREGQVVDKVERLPRRMPDGSIGVEYMGLVYPIARAGRASLDGRWCYSSEAPICLDELDEPLDDDKRFWTIDRSGTRPYIFINGSEALLGETLSSFARAKIPVEHHGPSFRESESGLLHDWFVRLEPATAPSDWELAQLLAEVSEPLVNSDTGSPDLMIARLRRDHDRLATKLIAAERELAETLSNADANEAELARTRDEAARNERRLETEAAFLRAGLEAVRSRGAADDADALRDLRIRIDSLSSDRDDALVAWTRAEEAAAQLRLRLEAAQAELAEVAARPSGPTFTSKRQGRADAELQTVMKALLPSIAFVRGSIDFILTEVEDRRDLYGKLRLLVDNPVSVGGKRVHAVDGWLEVHMSTGRGRDGRLYYKKREHGWSVLVSDKAAQANDFQWLKTQ